MRILIAFGVEELFAWTDIASRLRRRELVVYAPLLTCRDLIEDMLGIDPGQGDVKQLALKMRELIDSQASGTFLRMFLWCIKECEAPYVITPPGAPEVVNDYVQGMVLLSDSGCNNWVASLKQATLHNITSIGFGPVSGAVDKLHPELPTLEKFLEVVDEHFSTFDPKMALAQVEVVPAPMEPQYELKDASPAVDEAPAGGS